ncbi:MAG: hypothetical protein E6575_15055, partial [Bradyrhizobium sp.]|nr:hypothetical protein [Bradyrhizobium sp.]
QIELGGDWKAEIAFAVKNADIFIAVYTGDQKHVFDYCGFEVGLFTASEPDGMKRRMFCIYDTKEPPTILSGLQGVQIRYDAGEKLLKSAEGWTSEAFAPRMKAMFSLCYKLYAERRKAHLQDQSEKKSREIIQAFYANKGDEVVDERPLHQRISITLPAVTDWDTMAGIPPTSRVLGTITSFSLLGVPNAVPERLKDQDIYGLDWKDLTEILTKRAGNVVPWIRYVEASIMAQLKAGVTQPPPLSFIGEDLKPYRPIIGRFKVFRNGTRRYYVSLIPTLERLFPGRDETSFPLIGLIFAARFWFKFGEERQKLRDQFSVNATDNAFDLEVRSLDSYLQRMVIEASEYGLADQTSMKNFMKAEDGAIIEHFFVVWKHSYDSLSAVLKGWIDRKVNKPQVADAIERFSNDLLPQNEKFMTMMFRELEIQLPILRTRGHSSAVPVSAEPAR